MNFLAESKIMSSKSEARRAIANNGLKLNNKLIKDEKKILNLDDFTNKILKISHGKKTFHNQNYLIFFYLLFFE